MYWLHEHRPIIKPPVSVEEVFSALNVNIFCIHDVNQNAEHFYIYHEGVAKNGPYKVRPFINVILD